MFQPTSGPRVSPGAAMARAVPVGHAYRLIPVQHANVITVLIAFLGTTGTAM
jgi:hypothetical protein